MKFYKRLLLIILPFVFTGCTVNYNIAFKNDNTVDENIKISESTSVLENSGYSVEEIVESKIVSYDDIISKNLFKVKKEYDKKTSVILSSKNKNIDKFIEMPFFTKMFNGADIKETKKQFSFKTNGQYNQSGLFYDLSGIVDEGFVDVININIKFEDKVVSTNADSYDEEKNIYTWTIDKDTTEKSIEFELLKSNKKEKKELKFDKNIIIFIFSLIVILIVVLIYVLFLNQKRNKI